MRPSPSRSTLARCFEGNCGRATRQTACRDTTEAPVQPPTPQFPDCSSARRATAGWCRHLERAPARPSSVLLHSIHEVGDSAGPAEVSTGQPDPETICTSIVERRNLSTRMATRRFTRLTNGFSKKWENHWAAVALWFTFYNFCRVHKSLLATPAMEAGISDHSWTVPELLA